MSKNSIDSLMPVLIAPGHPSKIIKFDHVAIDLSGSDDDSFGKLATVRGIQKINDEFENSNLMVYDLFLDSASSFSFKVACSSIEIAFALLLYLEKRILNKKGCNASFYNDPAAFLKISFPDPFDFKAYSIRHPFIIESERLFKIPPFPRAESYDSSKACIPDFASVVKAKASIPIYKERASVRRDSVISADSASNSETASHLVAGIGSHRKSGAGIKVEGGKGGIIDAACFKLIDAGQETRTTVMIRNIPNKYTPAMLQEFLDIRVPGLYDFLYLRMDFKNRCNVGYAFINFVAPKSILLLKEVVGVKMPKFKSEKKLAISFASIQGLDKLIEKFQNSSIMLQDDKDWRPKLYHTEDGPLKGQEKSFPAPKDGQYRAKSEVLYCRQ